MPQLSRLDCLWYDLLTRVSHWCRLKAWGLDSSPVQQVPRQEGVDVGEVIETDEGDGLAHGANLTAGPVSVTAGDETGKAQKRRSRVGDHISRNGRQIFRKPPFALEAVSETRTFQRLDERRYDPLDLGC